ncbi:hypothetical protein JW933_07495, partial [candidate division FCPU426 bacterium]|nr:hypothetical protein [candidate division FCPU426 bacterium]
MPLRSLLVQLRKDPVYNALCRHLENTPKAKVWLTGLWGSAFPFFWSGVREYLRRPILIVMPTLEEARILYDRLRLFLEHPDPEREELFLFPSREMLPYEHALPDMDIEGERLEVLLRLARGEKAIVVAALEQARELIPDQEWLLKRVVTLTKGEYWDRDKLVGTLIERGYVREAMVEGRGQFAVRGGILDVFPPAELAPWRIEFEGSRIESVRQFALAPGETSIAGPATQADIGPARLFCPAPQEVQAGLARLERSLGRERVRLLRSQMEDNPHQPGLEHYLPAFVPCGILLDYFPDEAVIVVEAPGAGQKQAHGEDERNQRLYGERCIKEPTLPQAHELFLPFADLGQKLQHRNVVQTGRLKQSVWLENEPATDWAVIIKGTTPLRGNLELLLKEAQALRAQGLDLHLVAYNRAEEKRLKRILAEHAVQLQAPDLVGRIAFHIGQLSEGMQYPACGFVLFTDQEIFNRHFGRPSPRRQKGSAFAAQPAADILELKIGDLAVHQDHGVARYQGVVKLNIDGGEKEFVLLAYAGEEKLYVPTDQLRLVEKYIGGEHAPRINKLGTGAWERTKQRVRESVAELARQLLDIYAARQVHQA